jgi:hypothetical protein
MGKDAEGSSYKLYSSNSYVVSLPGGTYKEPHSHYLALHTESEVGLPRGRELTARLLG